jgi:hypothetical protein
MGNKLSQQLIPTSPSNLFCSLHREMETNWEGGGGDLETSASCRGSEDWGRRANRGSGGGYQEMGRQRRRRRPRTKGGRRRWLRAYPNSKFGIITIKLFQKMEPYCIPPSGMVNAVLGGLTVYLMSSHKTSCIPLDGRGQLLRLSVPSTMGESVHQQRQRQPEAQKSRDAKPLPAHEIPPQTRRPGAAPLE